MEMVRVPSVMISAVGHEGNTLVVEFAGGSKYQYSPVSVDEYRDMVSADSVGKYFTANIKGVKEYSKVVEDE